MENERGELRTFYVTRMDEETLTLDGNNPLCGPRGRFPAAKCSTVRDATDAEEIRSGGPPPAGAARSIHRGCCARSEAGRGVRGVATIGYADRRKEVAMEEQKKPPVAQGARRARRGS
ncbi:MAG: hypothetical protein RML56_06730 [Burkholderiales bacterium]|nr:hypothetical protein [Burkholderiales bacterium]